jgi:DNA-binding beta-propeller fold protein YncE
VNVRRAREPHNRSTQTNKRTLPLLLCAVAMGTLLASSASAQVVEGYIQLPDSFGPILAPYHIAVDYSPGAERLFVGSDSGDVIVVDAVNFRKLARITTGHVTSLCYSSVENNLYATAPSETVAVIDGATYQVMRRLSIGEHAAWLFYNPLVNRVYCGTPNVKVIDCSTDSITATIPVVGPGSCMVLDSYYNRLYVGTSGPIRVIDCYSDSVVGSIPEVCGTTAICYNPTTRRVYATASQEAIPPAETLHVIDTNTDSVVSQVRMPILSPDYWPTFALCSDPVNNRVYSECMMYVAALDCSVDALTWYEPLYHPSGIACVPLLDKVYTAATAEVISRHGATGQFCGTVLVDLTITGPLYLERMQRLYCATSDGRLAMIDCVADSVLDVIPLTAVAEQVCLDTVGNKLYFAHTVHYGYLGVVDCATRRVQSLQMCRFPREMEYDALDDKLYVVTKHDTAWKVSVYDCRTDSLIKVIPTDYMSGGFLWYPGLNKVYAGTIDLLGTDSDAPGTDFVTVIDCETDSIERILPRGTRDDPFLFAVLAPDAGQFWGFTRRGYAVVDCSDESIVMDSLSGFRGAAAACYSTSESAVYYGHDDYPPFLTALSTVTYRPTRDIELPLGEGVLGMMTSTTTGDKIMGALLTEGLYTDSVYVVDTRTDSLTVRADAGCIVNDLCADATGRYVYCTGVPETLLVVDTRNGGAVHRVGIPGMGGWGYDMWLRANRRTGRIYVGPGSNGRLVVFRDSVVVGVEERTEPTYSPVLLQTVVSRTVPFHTTARADLFDASGRRTAVLRSGPNDISHLAPGVYFVREEPQAANLKPQAVRKIVVTR